MRFLVCLLLSLPLIAAADVPGYCGKFDLREMANDDLLNILFLSNPQLKREQCGIFPGENLPLCSACDSGDGEALMTTLRPVLGDKIHLAWHSSWHKIRGLETIDDVTFAKLQRAGYVPAGYSREQFLPHLAGGKLAGEDFLFMHRLMLKMVQLELAFAGKPCLAPWRDLPSSEYGGNPVSLQTYRSQLSGLREVKFLKSVKTLNRLGAVIEPLLHQNLHGYYRDPVGCGKEALAQGYCDDLVPPETSPLNRHFWKIHGLVDSLIGDWLTVHGYSEIAIDCGSRERCYQWQGTWVGAYPKKTI